MRRFLFPLFPLFAAALLQCQTVTRSGGEPSATFQSNVPVVLVDVVVTNHRGEPVPGLKSTDFQLFEDGKRQTVASFEEHKGSPPTEAKLPPMPPGVFTNFPTVTAADSVNVLVVDGLNTQILDQTFVHSEILKYLKTIPPGARVAVFTLTTRLRLLQEFTTDSSALLAAVKSAALPYHSPLLQSEGELHEEKQFSAFLAAERVAVPVQTPEGWTQESVNPSAALGGMFGEQAEALTEMRMHSTLESLQRLGRYLAAFPGRKNVLWVSGSFPILFFPREDLPAPFQFSSVANFIGEIQRTAHLLTAARVAIYPVGAQGLMTDEFYQANADEIGRLRGSQLTQGQVNFLRDDRSNRLNNSATMDELARDTGGQAFYDTNGVGDVLSRVTSNSAEFYTISYVPTNRKVDGKFRRISVKCTPGKEHLSYRRGYYADDENMGAAKESSDPLLPLVGFSVPDISQIVYKIRIAPSKAQGSDSAGKQPGNTKGKVVLTTYDIDYAISLGDLKLDSMPDGSRHGNIELKLVAYDDYGKPLDLAGVNSALSLTPKMYAAMQKVGLQQRQQISIPNNVQVHLRTGIYDYNSGKVGTLGLKLSTLNTSKRNPKTANH